MITGCEFQIPQKARRLILVYLCPSRKLESVVILDIVQDLVAWDCFPVPTATFRVRFVCSMLAHARRRIGHCTITAHPTAAWTAQQSIEAFPWAPAPRSLRRDRAAVDGTACPSRVTHLGIDEVTMAPRRPWHNP